MNTAEKQSRRIGHLLGNLCFYPGYRRIAGGSGLYRIRTATVCRHDGFCRDPGCSCDNILHAYGDGTTKAIFDAYSSHDLRIIDDEHDLDR